MAPCKPRKSARAAAPSPLPNALATPRATELVFLFRPSSWTGRCRPLPVVAGLLAAVGGLLPVVAGLLAAVGELLAAVGELPPPQATAPITATAPTHSAITPRVPPCQPPPPRAEGPRDLVMLAA